MIATQPVQLAFLGLPGGMEWVVILVVGLLLFGARLPMVGRNIGKSITEFKKGLKDASEEAQSGMDGPATAGHSSAPKQLSNEQMEAATQEALRRLKADQAAKTVAKD
jgi:sec-independent protein translocase protein TatA